MFIYGDDRYSGRDGFSYSYAPDYYRNRYRGGWLRLRVDPGHARVYAGDHYAGTAHDFDGTPNWLYFSPGRHDITLELEGYQTHRLRFFVRVGQAMTIHHVMRRGPGETSQTVGKPQD